jgi:hypothetical protein
MQLTSMLLDLKQAPKFWKNLSKAKAWSYVFPTSMTEGNIEDESDRKTAGNNGHQHV